MVVCFVSAQACDMPHECTAIGCIDSASFEIKTADGTWPDGAYALEVIADGITHACSMTLPDDLPGSGTASSIPCDPPVGYMGVSLTADTACTEHGDEDSGSVTCTPIPDHYTLRGSVPGTPSTLGIRVTRDGGLLLEQTLPLHYTETQPNGPDCEPVCRQSSVDLVLP
jgi:hypothetical protein